MRPFPELLRFTATALKLALAQTRLRTHPGTEAQLQFAKVAADGAHKAKRDFLAVMSHEIRAPLDAVMGFARPPRILVVDDLETNRFLLEVFLRRNGFEPELAKGGAEAIRLAAANRYDAILMDLQMPGVDGYTATTRIRAAEPPGHHTPIIALTASIGKGIREKCLAAGMDEHLTKPLDLARFKRVLKSMLGTMVTA